MEKGIRISRRTFVLILSALSLLFFASAQAADLVAVKDGLLSVNLKENSLLDVARDIEKQSGVWFRGDETLFQEKISVSFSDLPLEEGLKRILANLNYSLMFDIENKVAGVMVMGEGTPAVTQPARPGAQPPRATTPPRTSTRPAPAVRSKPSTSTPPSAVRRPPRVAPQPAQGGIASQPPGSAPAQPATPDASKVQESDGPLPPAFRVIENAPPPGGPVADKEAPEVPRLIRTAPSPSGTAQGTTASPGDSKPAANTPSPEEASKSVTTP
jgi:hypothetical protein